MPATRLPRLAVGRARDYACLRQPLAHRQPLVHRRNRSMSPAEARLKEVPSEMTETEWTQRVNLAACYRLVALYGWDDLVDTHISARVPGPDHHFLINPYGLMFEEITA